MREVLCSITNWGLATRQGGFKYFSYGFSGEVISKIKLNITNKMKSYIRRTIKLIVLHKSRRNNKTIVSHKTEKNNKMWHGSQTGWNYNAETKNTELNELAETRNQKPSNHVTCREYQEHAEIAEISRT